MAKWGLFGLVLWPILEITLFVVVGGAIGILATLGIILATFLLGIAILRRQKTNVTAGSPVAVSTVAHQILLFFAAICLILPGFLGDLVGLLLLIRPVRSLVIGLITVTALSKFADLAKRGGMAQADDILEGDFVDVTPQTALRPRVTDRQDH